MANEETDSTEDTEKKRSKLPLIIGLVLALAGGAGGFFAVQSGLLFGSDSKAAQEDGHATDMDLPDVAFVPIEPIIVTLATEEGLRHLKFSAQLEVPPKAKSNVEALLPRVVDVFNSYLRAVKLSDLEEPTALIKFRSHLLRRAELVLGDGAVNNILIMEFVLNQ